MDHAEAHGTLAHPEHRQGDVVLADGARLFTCTKNVRDGMRTSMLLIAGLCRVDVVSTAGEFEVLMRNLSGGTLEGGPAETISHRASRSFEGRDEHVSEFWFEPASGPVGRVNVTISRPAERGAAFPCTAMALVPRKASA